MNHKVNLLEKYIELYKTSEFLMAKFRNRIKMLEDYYSDALDRDYDFYYQKEQLRFLFTFFRQMAVGVKYVTKYQSDNMAVSLYNKHSKQYVSIFFNHLDLSFAVVSGKYIVAEAMLSFPHPSYVYKLADNNQFYLYTSRGDDLNVRGDQIEMTSGCFGNHDNREFVIAWQGKTFDLYSSKLQLILNNCENYEIKGDGYQMLIEKDGKKHLGSSSKGLAANLEFQDIQYHCDRYYLHNELEFYVLKNRAQKYALFHISKWVLWSDFEWDELTLDMEFDYCFGQKEGKLYKIRLDTMFCHEVKEIVFDKRIY